MALTPTFNEILQLAERLTPDEKEAIADVLKRRTIDARRRQWAREVKQASTEHRRGKTRPATADQIMDEILR